MSDLIPRIQIPLYESQMEYARRALLDGQLALGPHIEELETRLAGLFGKRHVVLAANGFSAIFLALKSLGNAPFDVLTAPASTCYAAVNAIKASGNRAVFSEMQLSSASLCQVDEAHRYAVVPNHFGLIAPACTAWSNGVSRRVLIEDACQSFHSRIRSVSPADVMVLSFYPTKFANGVDGGALLTDDPDIYSRAKRLVSYTDQLEYEREPRFNLKLNNLNAAVALGSLQHMDETVDALLAAYRELSRVLDHLGIQYLAVSETEVPTRLVLLAENGEQRDAWVSRLRAAGIQAGTELLYVCPEKQRTDYPVCRRLVECSLSLPFHPLITVQDLEKIELELRCL